MRDLAWSLAGRVSMITSMFLINVILARLLSKDDFGRFLLCFSVISVAGLLCPLGLNNMAVRAVATEMHAGRRDQVLPTIITILGITLVGGLILAMLMTGPGAGFMYRLISAGHPAPELLVGTALWTIGYGIQLSLAEVLRAAGRIRPASFAGGAASHLGFVGLLVVLWATSHPIVLEQVLLAEAGIVAITLLLFLRPLALAYRGYPWRWSSRRMIDLVLEALPAALLPVIGLLMTQMDVLALGLFRPSIVGVYGAASRLVLMLTVPGVVLEGALAPRLAILVITNKRQDLQNMCRAMASTATLAACVMLALFLIGGAQLTAGIFGAGYRPSARFLNILAFGYVASPLCGSALLLFILAGRQRIALALLATCATIFAGCLLLAARFGSGEAVAITAACGLWGTLLILSLAARQVLGVWTIATPSSVAAALRQGRNLWREKVRPDHDSDRP